MRKKYGKTPNEQFKLEKTRFKNKVEKPINIALIKEDIEDGKQKTLENY